MSRRGVSDAAILPPASRLTGAQSAIALEWGPGSDNAEAGDQRWFGAPRFGVGYLALNPPRARSAIRTSDGRWPSPSTATL